jgi:hypothetical protein
VTRFAFLLIAGALFGGTVAGCVDPDDEGASTEPDAGGCATNADCPAGQICGCDDVGGGAGACEAKRCHEPASADGTGGDVDAAATTEDATTSPPDATPPPDASDSPADSPAPPDATTGLPDACGDGIERCDGLDNDCDGRVDEDYPALGQACEAGIGGCLSVGVVVCEGDGGGTLCTAKPASEVPEVCDAVDNDCDGATDEAVARPCYGGPTGTEGVGVCVAGIRGCAAGEPEACAGETRPSPEICDGLDNDCDGTTDEAAANDACYDGPDAELEAPRGLCRVGRLSCAGGAPGPCVGQVRPAARDGCDGLNEDCDGAVDEDCECVEGVACEGTGVGQCRPGVQRCGPNGLVTCEGAVAPTEEICNGLDDDCDRIVDEGADTRCYDGPDETEAVGACRAGVQRCVGGVLRDVCEGEVRPSVEVCDGVDDDCDGATDEGFGVDAACTLGAGTCEAAGRVVCVGGEGRCDAIAGAPGVDRCNGLDDDCDGATDEETSAACYPGPAATVGVGACRRGLRRCGADGQLGACEGAVVPTDEACGDDVDDDCDGATDEACGCEAGARRTCGTDTGACARGLQTCRGGTWSACEGATTAAPETCDGTDEDCDGATDEGTGGEACYDGPARSLGVGACGGGRLACVNGERRCVGQVLPTDEACDGVDRDCDGAVDERDDRVGAFCRSDRPGLCGPGHVECAAGALVCVPDVGPAPEGCNATDDDCDGVVDEAIRAGSCDASFLGAMGACSQGFLECAAGAIWCRPGSPAGETCNGLDDDCDGIADESTDGRPCVTAADAVCSVGTTLCEAGVRRCVESEPAPDVCGDRRDEDCDGRIDEGPAVTGPEPQEGLSGFGDTIRATWTDDQVILTESELQFTSVAVVNPRSGRVDVATRGFECGGGATTIDTPDGFLAVCPLWPDVGLQPLTVSDDSLLAVEEPTSIPAAGISGVAAVRGASGGRLLFVGEFDGTRTARLYAIDDLDALTHVDLGPSNRAPALAVNAARDRLGAVWVQYQDEGIPRTEVWFQDLPAAAPRGGIPCCARLLEEVPGNRGLRDIGITAVGDGWAIWWTEGLSPNVTLQVRRVVDGDVDGAASAAIPPPPGFNTGAVAAQADAGALRMIWALTPTDNGTRSIYSVRFDDELALLGPAAPLAVGLSDASDLAMRLEDGSGSIWLSGFRDGVQRLSLGPCEAP